VVGLLPMRLSVFQGSVLIRDRDFTRLFPSESGFRAFLVGDASQAQESSETLAARLNREFREIGMEAEPAVQRLRTFYAVESTYLALFLVLGALGLMLGSGGAAIVVLRNLFERRAELGLFHALGAGRALLVRMLVAEQAVLVSVGVVSGALAALVAIFPLALAAQTSVRLSSLMLVFGFVVVCHAAAAVVAVLTAVPRDFSAGLRME